MNNNNCNTAVTKNPIGGIFNNLLGNSISDIIGGDFISTTPSINILEEKDQFIIEVASPGLTKKDFDIKIDDEYLVISAAKTEEKTEEEYSRKEFNYTSFTRKFNLPETVDHTQVDATYTNGILNITLKKIPEAVKTGPVEISIK